jgi:molecular chaperone DnaJ
MANDYYELLGVTRTATPQEIKSAYRKLAMKYHPDRNPGDKEAEAMFKRVQEAYDTLSDPGKRAYYNGNGTPGPTPGRRQSRRQRPFHQGASSEFQSIFEEFFGGGVDRGRNIQVRVECELLEIVQGCHKTIQYKKRNRCTSCEGQGFTKFNPCGACGGSGFAQVTESNPFQFVQQCVHCHGSGKIAVERCSDCGGGGFTALLEKQLTVTIPPGIDNGMQVRVRGEGEEGRLGSRTGDLFVVVLIKEHPIFKRNGADLVLDVPVSYTQLVLGQEIEIPTLKDGIVNVKMPVGTQSNTRFRLKGKGLPHLQTPTVLGDIIATVKVETPNELCDEYKELIEKLAEVEKKHITPRREAFAKKVS